MCKFRRVFLHTNRDFPNHTLQVNLLIFPCIWHLTQCACSARVFKNTPYNKHFFIHFIQGFFFRTSNVECIQRCSDVQVFRESWWNYIHFILAFRVVNVRSTCWYRIRRPIISGGACQISKWYEVLKPNPTSSRLCEMSWHHIPASPTSWHVRGHSAWLMVPNQSLIGRHRSAEKQWIERIAATQQSQYHKIRQYWVEPLAPVNHILKWRC